MSLARPMFDMEGRERRGGHKEIDDCPWNTGEIGKVIGKSGRKIKKNNMRKCAEKGQKLQ